MMSGSRKKRVMEVAGASLGKVGRSGSFVLLFGRREIIVFGKVVGIGKVDLILVLVIANNGEEVHSRSSFYSCSALLYH